MCSSNSKESLVLAKCVFCAVLLFAQQNDTFDNENNETKTKRHKELFLVKLFPVKFLGDRKKIKQKNVWQKMQQE